MAIFRITAIFATEHPRQLWQEKKYLMAIDYLISFGIDYENCYNIIIGKKKFEEVGTNEFIVVDDNWHSEYECYPNPFTDIGDIQNKYSKGRPFDSVDS